MTTDPTSPSGLAEEAIRFDQGEALTLKADGVICERRAEELMERHAQAIRSAKSKTIFIFDLLSGDYVQAGSRLEALDAFEARFGLGSTVGWVHAIDDPIFVGGGLGQS